MSWIWMLSAYVAGLAVFLGGFLIGGWLSRGKQADLDAAYQRLSGELHRYLHWESTHVADAATIRSARLDGLRDALNQCDELAGLAMEPAAPRPPHVGEPSS